MTNLRRIGVIANLDKPPAIEVAGEAVDYLHGRITTLVLQKALAEKIGHPKLSSENEPLTDTDVVLVFGGDGTMLASSRRCVPTNTPMLGVNMGRFGFLTETMPEQLLPSLDRLLTGQFEIEERLVLSCRIVRDGKTVDSDQALNDVVVAHGPLARVLHLATSINGNYLTTYAADGIIIASPTGSTAYSLSAGGPLVHPEIKAMLMTPVCPHTLTTRTLLVPAHHIIQIHIERTDGDQVQVTVDGQRGLPLASGDMVQIQASENAARLITRIGGASFYEKLQTKLRWGERIVI